MEKAEPKAQPPARRKTCTMLREPKQTFLRRNTLPTPLQSQLPPPPPPPDPRENINDNILKCAPTQEDDEAIFQLLDNGLKNDFSQLKAQRMAALATIDALSQMKHLSSMWYQYLQVEKKWRKDKERLKYISLLEQKRSAVIEKIRTVPDGDSELEQSIALLESILDTSESVSTKFDSFKHTSERSESFIVEARSGMQESKELSIHSEPSSSNRVNSRKIFQQKQDEINQRHAELRVKIEGEFEEKWRLWDKTKNQLQVLTQQEQAPASEPTKNLLPLRIYQKKKFIKKMEEWDKMKRKAGSRGVGDTAAASTVGNNLMKSKTKKRATKKASDDDRPSWDRDELNKSSERRDKDKSEKFAQLKAIATDYPALSLEGVSSKFKKKISKWEKSRGIEPKSSVFALLNPSCSAIDVGRTNNMDSASPTAGLSNISQVHSFSLNDISDSQEVSGVWCSEVLAEFENITFDEPESPTNVAALLAMLKRTDELFAVIKNASPDIALLKALQLCGASLLLIRNAYTYFTKNLMKLKVMHAISDVQIELSRLAELHKKSPLNEACCTEIMEERNNEYKQGLRDLYVSLEVLRESIQNGQNLNPIEIEPCNNVTSEDGFPKNQQQ